MEIYCVTCKKTLRIISNVRRTKQNRLMLLSNCAICGKKKSRSKRIITPLSNIPLIGDILF